MTITTSVARLSALGIVTGILHAASADPPPLSDVQVIALPGVQRRIDHFAVDPAGKRLFVAALGNGTLEVLDLDAGKRITSVAGLKEPQGVAYLPGAHEIVVAMRGGSVAAFDDQKYQRTATLPKLGDADNLRYDAAASQLYVGYGEGALGVLAPATLRRDRVYVIGGEGYVDVFDAAPSGKYPRLAHVATRAGARTGLWSAELDRLFVAWPSRDGKPAEIHVLAAPGGSP